MSELQLAPTIRTPRPDEVPQHKDILDNIQRKQIANIVEGFTLRENASHEQPFTFYCEINIDNSKLWHLFQAFLLQFPDEVYFIYGHKDTDTLICTSYKDKFEILNMLSPYETELTQDGFLKFGVAFHTVGSPVYPTILLGSFIRRGFTVMNGYGEVISLTEHEKQQILFKSELEIELEKVRSSEFSGKPSRLSGIYVVNDDEDGKIALSHVFLSKIQKGLYDPLILHIKPIFLLSYHKGDMQWLDEYQHSKDISCFRSYWMGEHLNKHPKHEYLMEGMVHPVNRNEIELLRTKGTFIHPCQTYWQDLYQPKFSQLFIE